MTTIACTPRVMASDSQATDENGISHVTKMWEVGNGVLGFAGTFHAGYKLYQWLLAGQAGDPPDMKDSVALFIDGRQIWCFDGVTSPYPIDDKNAAIGSGAMAARACMLVGCSPEQSVKIAAKVDPYTGGKIKVLEV